MTDFIALLGTKGGPAIRPKSTMPTSHLLRLSGQTIVVDCGLGVSRGIADQGFDLKNLSYIFITHLHSDHYLELGPLLHTAWTAGLKTPITVYGPAGIDTYWQGFLASMQADIDLRIADEGRPDLRGLLVIEVIDPDEAIFIGDICVQAMRTIHPPLVDCYALSFKTPKRHVVFSGDTAFLPSLADFAHGADLLIHEAMLVEALDALMARIGNGDDRLMKHLLRSHTRAEDVGRIAQMAQVKALAINHLVPSDDPAFGPDDWERAIRKTWQGPLHIGHDGLRITFD